GVGVLCELRSVQVEYFPHVARFDLAFEMPEMIGEHRNERIVGKALPLFLRRLRPQFARQPDALTLCFARCGLCPKLIAVAPQGVEVKLHDQYRPEAPVAGSVA